MQNCYERNSVEDLVRLSRIDSEALFQRWLNRIPSAGALNEAAALQQQLEHVSAGPTADLLAASAAMPRVPSLQFLTQLASAQQLANAAAIRDQAAALVAPSAGFGALPTAALPSTSVNGNARDVDPELTAAKALNQLSQPHSHSHVTNGMSEGTSPSSNDKDIGGKSDNRKARRMLSNRESARRSRKRKQEHLSKLEQEINVMLEEKRTWTEKASSLERQCTSMEDENGRLREENARLRDELQFLRSELSCLTRRRLHHHDDDTRPSNDLKQET